MKKKIYVDRFIFLAMHMHPQNAPITASSENVPNSQSYAYRRKYYDLFKQNILSAHIRKNRQY